jgi:hypothetical protein
MSSYSRRSMPMVLPVTCLDVFCRMSCKSFYQLRTAAFSTSSHHCRKLVGVVFSGVRGSALSKPSFLATIMSSVPCAIAADIPDPVSLALNASPGICWKRTGFLSTSDMICAMSLKDKSSGPRTATCSRPLQDGSSRSLAATAAMSRVAHVGSLRSPEIGETKMLCFLPDTSDPGMTGNGTDGLISGGSCLYPCAGTSRRD